MNKRTQIYKNKSQWLFSVNICEIVCNRTDTPSKFSIQLWLTVRLGFLNRIFLFLGVISKIKAAKRYAVTKLLSKPQQSNSSTVSLTNTDESSRQRSQTRTTSTRGSQSHSKTLKLNSSSRSGSESESKSFDEESSSDEEEDEEDYRPGKHHCHFYLFFYSFKAAIIESPLVMYSMIAML